MRFKAVFYFLFLSVFMLFTSCENTLVFHDSHESKRQNTPFSDAVETDDFFFLSVKLVEIILQEFWQKESKNKQSKLLRI